MVDHEETIIAPANHKGYGGGRRGRRYGKLPPPGRQRNRPTRSRGRKTGKRNR